MDRNSTLHASPVIREATPTASYSLRAPSPPYIPVPLLARGAVQEEEFLHLTPSSNYVDANNLTSNEINAITRNTTQIATDRAATWSYEQRRKAQTILDFLYLGPSSVVRDHTFLRDEGITMVVVVRDARLGAMPLLSVTRAAEALGLHVYYVNIESLYQLIRDLPEVICELNRHLLQVYREKPDPGCEEVRRGKILVTCDTGNDKSAAVVCAYIMTMFGTDMLTTLQFVSIQRFCCTFDEDVKRMLQTYQGILQAKAAVAADERLHGQHSVIYAAKSTKRGIDSTMDMDMDSADGGGWNSDRQRFAGREAFAPFADAE